MGDRAWVASTLHRTTKGEEHMTNYDRWKLATPDYLEDTDADLSIHATDVDAGGGYDLRGDVQHDKPDAEERAG